MRARNRIRAFCSSGSILSAENDVLGSASPTTTSRRSGTITLILQTAMKAEVQSRGIAWLGSPHAPEEEKLETVKAGKRLEPRSDAASVSPRPHNPRKSIAQKVRCPVSLGTSEPARIASSSVTGNSGVRVCARISRAALTALSREGFG